MNRQTKRKGYYIDRKKILRKKEKKKKKGTELSNNRTFVRFFPLNRTKCKESSKIAIYLIIF